MSEFRKPVDKGTQVEQEFALTKKWLEAEVMERISVDSNSLTKVGFLGIVNRTNTGALATAFGRTPAEERVLRHIQPIKALARRRMDERGQESITPLEYLKDEIEFGPGVHIVKETVGPDPDNPAEWLDSFDMLLRAGVPPEKMFFVPTFRDPFDTIASWRKMWKWKVEDIPFESFNQSHEMTVLTMERARNEGIPVVPYVHEFLRDNDPKIVMGKMYEILNLPFSEDVVVWNGPGDPYWQKGIVKYDQPPDEWIQGALSTEKGGRGGLVWRETINQLTNEEREFVAENIQPAIAIYDAVVERTQEMLQLK